MASPLTDQWIYTTVQIENEWEGGGTGFLVSRYLDDEQSKLFLVTNKHVLHKRPETRANAKTVTLHLNVQDDDGALIGTAADLPLSWDDGTCAWKEHPEPDVDVLAFNVTPLMVSNPQITYKAIPYSLFADDNVVENEDITMGDEIVTIGYPAGISHHTSNLPLLREGIIATRIGESLQDQEREEDGHIRERVLRGFLIDGVTVPGSSGSPVVLKPTTGRFKKGNVVVGSSTPFLLGIVAETRYAPIQTAAGNLPSFAGLGLAFDADTVKETVERFFV